MWSIGHELKYWNKTGLEKGKNIYLNYYSVFSLDKYDFVNKKILDIGCGPFGGVFCFEDKFDVIPMDILAKEYNSMNVSNRKIVFGDLSKKIKVDCKFDYIICTNALDHIPDINHGLKELYRVLQPDGILFLYVHLRNKKQLNKAHVHELNEKRITKKIKKRGFHIEECLSDVDWVNNESGRVAVSIVCRK